MLIFLFRREIKRWHVKKSLIFLGFFSADIANINNGIKTIRQNLDTLKLPTGLEKNFLNLISKLETEMNSFEAKTKDGLGSKLDSHALEKKRRKNTRAL